MKKHSFFLVIVSALLLHGIPTFAADDEEQAMVLHLKDGSQVAYFLSSSPKLTFADSQLTLKTVLAEVSYPTAALARYCFEMKSPTKIGEIENGQKAVRFEGNEIRVSGFPAGQQLEVYATDGRKVASQPVGANGNATVSLQALPVGVYLIHHGVSTYKVEKR